MNAPVDVASHVDNRSMALNDEATLGELIAGNRAATLCETPSRLSSFGHHDDAARINAEERVLTAADASSDEFRIPRRALTLALLTCVSEWAGDGDCAAINMCRWDEDGQGT